LETVPTIKALRSKAEAIRAGEFEKAANKLGDGLSKKQLKVGGGSRLCCLMCGVADGSLEDCLTDCNH
jgi:hypothetical protein